MEKKSNLCIEQLLDELKEKGDTSASLGQCISSHIVLCSHNIHTFVIDNDSTSSIVDDTFNDEC